MSNTSTAQVETLLQDEYLGTDLHGSYRPDLTIANLDVSKVDKSKIIDGFCNFVRIPFVAPQRADDQFIHEQMFCYLVDKVASGFNDVYPQPQDLFLIVDDNDGERKYYIGADVQIEDWDGQTVEISIEEINPTDKELAAIELALLKVTVNADSNLQVFAG